MASHRVSILIEYKKSGDNQITSLWYLDRTWQPKGCMESKNILSFLRVKHPAGGSITVKTFSSRTNRQQWPRMKRLELGESNEYLLYTRKAVFWLTSQGYVVQPHTHMHRHTRRYISFWHGRNSHRGHQRSPSLREAEFTYQMVAQNGFYCRGECTTKDLDGFSCLCWLWHFPCTQPWESWRRRVLFPALCTAPLCSTFLTGESENETSTNTPLFTMKYVLATGNVHKTDLVVSWRGDVEWGGSYGRLSGFRGASCTFAEVLRRQDFGFFPLYSTHALGLIYSVCTGSVCRLLGEQLGCPSWGINPARSP